MAPSSDGDDYRRVVEALAVAKEHRLVEIERDNSANAAGNAKLAETLVTATSKLAVHDTRLAALEASDTELRADLKGVRDGQRTLVLALLGFAFTVAGSAVGLALTLGGHP